MAGCRKQPEWVPEHIDHHHTYASEIMHGVEGGHDGLPGFRRAPHAKRSKRSILTIDDYVQGIRNGDKTILARAITLIESNAEHHLDEAQAVLDALMPFTGGALRIGVTGSPGAGKSTFIEAFGNQLCDCGKKLAVLSIDPSSSVTGGSLLGDKTRMETLCRREEAFIRPSPSAGALGGVARKTRETLLLCEAAGYDLILIETVGVGQSEVTVRSLVDIFLLVLLTGAGDDLQDMKKGVMELADIFLVNKADGDNLPRARAKRADLLLATAYIRPATEGWKPPSMMCSSLTRSGLPELWEMMEKFETFTRQTGIFATRRRLQNISWFHNLLDEIIRKRFYQDPRVKGRMTDVEQAVANGTLNPTQASRMLSGLVEKKSCS